MNSYSGHSGLLTDLYQLTMAAGYIETGFDARATFELFVRNLPPRRNYLVAAGLEQALDYLQNVRFTADEIAYLQRLSGTSAPSSLTTWRNSVSLATFGPCSKGQCSSLASRCCA